MIFILNLIRHATFHGHNSMYVRRPDPFSFREGCGYARLISMLVCEHHNSFMTVHVALSWYPVQAVPPTVDMLYSIINLSQTNQLLGGQSIGQSMCVPGA